MRRKISYQSCSKRDDKDEINAYVGFNVLKSALIMTIYLG